MNTLTAKQKYIGILAIDPNGVIGKDGQLPWHYPEETAHFQNIVRNQVMIMGYKTFVDTPNSLLATTTNVVFSRKDHDIVQNNTYFVKNFDDFFALTLPQDKNYYVIGGAEIITLFLEHNLLNELILSVIHQTFEGDTFFPLHLLKGFSKHLIKSNKDFSVYNYTLN